MPSHARSGSHLRVSPTFLILLAFLIMLWVAGGASRADVLGQAMVRGAAWAALAGACIFSPTLTLGRSRIVGVAVIVIVALVLVQLIPLPPALWRSLAGRDLIAAVAGISGEGQPWRPLALSPAATFNALSSLVVPVALLVLLAGLDLDERRYLPGLMLLFILAAALLGLLQASGSGLDNPFINDVPGEVSGPFANRNHFALLLGFGCVLAPIWAFRNGHHLPNRRAPVAVGLLLLFVLTIIGTGSRVGLLVGAIGILMGLAIVFRALRRTLDRYPRWVTFALLAGIVGALVVAILLSIAVDRAASIQRALSVDSAQDMRSRGLPTVFSMVRTYFPWGIGFGGFDTAFRIAEPVALLKPTYFNHAHNDLIEIVVEAGLLGLILLIGAVGATVWYGVLAWRAGGGMRHAVSKLGSAMIVQVLFASAFDYPARTPIMMAIIALAAVWLTGGAEPERIALPRRDRHL